MSVLQCLGFSYHSVKQKGEAQRGNAPCSEHTTCRWYNKDSCSEGTLALPLFLPQRLHLRPQRSWDAPQKKLLFSPLSSLIGMSFSPSVLLSQSSLLWSKLEAPSSASPLMGQFWLHLHAACSWSLIRNLADPCRQASLEKLQDRNKQWMYTGWIPVMPTLWDPRSYLCFYSSVSPSE